MTAREDRQRIINWKRRAARRALRLQAFAAYGGKCACCSEALEASLTFDHINGGGTQHRKQIREKKIYAWAISHSFPKMLQLLCRNCHASKNYDGRCQHERQREREQEREAIRNVSIEAW